MTRAVLVLLVAPALVLAAPHAKGTLDASGRLQVELAGSPEAPASSIVLNVDNAKWILPDAITPYEGTEQRLALVVVMQISQPWIDREAFQIAELFESALRTFRAPPGSTIAIVTFAQAAELRLASTPFANLPPKPFGTLADHRGKAGDELVAGVALGLTELGRSDAPMKQLIVVGEGTDAHPDQQPRMRALVERGIREGVQMHAVMIGYGRKTADDLGAPGLEPTAMTGNWAAEANERLRDILAMIAQRRVLTFAPGTVAADGRTHALQLEIGATKIPFAIGMPDARPPHPPLAPTPPRVSRWPLVGAGAAATAVVLLLLLLRRRAS